MTRTCHFKNKIMEITDRLRNTPTGFTVKVGEINVQVMRFVPCVNTKATICKGCAFRDEGARFCEYSSACMAHLRPDHESVVFAKTRET